MPGRTTPPKIKRYSCDLCGERRLESELRNHGKPDFPKWVCRDSFRCWGDPAYGRDPNTGEFQ